MDDIDIAQNLEQMQRDAAISAARSRIDIEKESRAKLREKGIALHCKCCGAELISWDKSYCNAECQQLHDDLKAAEKRKNG